MAILWKFSCTVFPMCLNFLKTTKLYISKWVCLRCSQVTISNFSLNCWNDLCEHLLSSLVQTQLSFNIDWLKSDVSRLSTSKFTEAERQITNTLWVERSSVLQITFWFCSNGQFWQIVLLDTCHMKFSEGFGLPVCVCVGCVFVFDFCFVFLEAWLEFLYFCYGSSSCI